LDRTFSVLAAAAEALGLSPSVATTSGDPCELVRPAFFVVDEHAAASRSSAVTQTKKGETRWADPRKIC
jgi:hypothetical protein